MRVRSWPATIAAALAVVLMLGTAFGLAREVWQKRQETATQAIRLTAGDPDRGEVLIQRFGCGGCHDIPGIPGARGRVGPPLGGIASRVYIGGKYANKPANMIAWIQHPQAMDPGIDMPEMGITEPQARDIAAYLYTLQ
ncbi:MAG TPA: c-type cytochrome [Caulobacteraceae bacterium]|nr:c-type cytochrome [Caulobacteraceae bacterium]